MNIFVWAFSIFSAGLVAATRHPHTITDSDIAYLTELSQSLTDQAQQLVRAPTGLPIGLGS